MCRDALVPRHRFVELNAVPLSVRMGSFTSQILGWGFFEPEWWRNYLHSHSFFEVCFVFAGHGTFRLLGQDYRVQAGDVFIARPGEAHEIVSSETEPMGIYFWSYTLHQESHYAMERDELDASDSLLTVFVQAGDFISSRTTTLQLVLELLTEEMAHKAPGYKQAIEGLVTKLLLDTARSVVQLEPVSREHDSLMKEPDAVLIRTIIQYLRDNYNRALSLRDIAAQVHVSERHMSRLFHKAMGVPVMDYLTTLRMEVAEQLLIEKQHSIKEVAQRTGYPDVRYFTTLFHRRTGLTPATFRQQGGTLFLS